MVLWGGGNTQWVVCLSVSVCAPEWKAETQIAELICHRQTRVWGDTRLVWDPPNWLSWSLPSLVMWRLCNVVQPAAGVEISHPTHKPSFLFPDKSFLVTTAILLTWPKEHPVSWIHYLQQFSMFIFFFSTYMSMNTHLAFECISFMLPQKHGIVLTTGYALFTYYHFYCGPAGLQAKQSLLHYNPHWGNEGFKIWHEAQWT